MLPLLVLPLLQLTAASGPAPGWIAANGVSKYAAFSVLNGGAHGTLEAALGPVQRGNGGEPLFRPNENPWETDIDNGYSSVLYDPDDSFGLGRYRVYYSVSLPSDRRQVALPLQQALSLPGFSGYVCCVTPLWCALAAGIGQGRRRSHPG
jgi:hypothetical protein